MQLQSIETSIRNLTLTILYSCPFLFATNTQARDSHCQIAALMGALTQGESQEFGPHFYSVIQNLLRKENQVIERLKTKLKIKAKSLEFNLRTARNSQVDIETRNYAQALLPGSKTSLERSRKRLREVEAYYKTLKDLVRGKINQSVAFRQAGFVEFQQEIIKRAIAQDSLSVASSQEQSLLLAQYQSFLNNVPKGL